MVHSPHGIRGTLIVSIDVLLKHPSLIFPKLLVALLYGFGVLKSITLAKQVLPVLSSFYSHSSAVLPDFSGLFSDVLLLLIVSAVAFFLDIIFSGVYPRLVETALEGRVSFSKAFSLVRKKLKLILFVGILAWLIVGALSAVLSVVLLFFNLNEVSWLFSFAVAFSFIFFFYFLFPTVVFKDDNVKSSFLDTLKESFSNGRMVFLFSLIPFSVSIVKFVVAFFADKPDMLFVYWVLVVITSVVYSVHAIANQVLFERIYLKHKKHFGD
ncbi:MAG: hypothetical protein NTY48_03580 [Candidatus Diapherotrites archaeon]|nr:hypothetical protein [Candidatus Diapherotrites archaeon]